MGSGETHAIPWQFHLIQYQVKWQQIVVQVSPGIFIAKTSFEAEREALRDGCRIPRDPFVIQFPRVRLRSEADVVGTPSGHWLLMVTLGERDLRP